MVLDYLLGKFRPLFLLCLLYSCSAQGIIAAKEDGDKQPSAIDTAAKTVLYLEFQQQAREIRDINGVKIECDLYHKIPGRKEYRPKTTRMAATGFLVQSEVALYVVTAKHAVKDVKTLGRYWLSPVEGKIESGTFDAIRAKIRGAKWFFHEHADVAVHPIVFKPEGRVFKVTPKDKLPKEPPELLTLVCIPGFPYTLGKDNVRLGPLVTTCDIASWPAILPQDPDTKVIFLSERLAKGYSGAPVFSLKPPPSRGLSTKHTMQLVGIQTGAYVFPVPWKGVVTTDELSYIVPVSYLVELLNSKEVQEFESDLRKRKSLQRKEQVQP